MFIVMTKNAAMPSRCMGRYVNVYVVEVCYYDYVRGATPPSINSKQVLRVASRRGPFNVGKTDKCASAIARKEAQAMADQLNNSRDMATVEDIIGAGGSA